MRLITGTDFVLLGTSSGLRIFITFVMRVLIWTEETHNYRYLCQNLAVPSFLSCLSCCYVPLLLCNLLKVLQLSISGTVAED